MGIFVLSPGHIKIIPDLQNRLPAGDAEKRENDL